MDQCQKQFLSSLAALLAKMAVADGVVTSDERNKATLIWRKLGLGAAQSEYCEKAFRIAQTDGVSLQRYVQEFVVTRFGADAREFLYGLMWDVACADGVLHKNEKSLLMGLRNGLGLPSDTYDIYYRRYVSSGSLAIDAEVEEQKEFARKRAEREWKRAEEESRRRERENARRRRERTNASNAMSADMASAYAMLGCEPSMSDECLKHAYRMAAMRWHPDRLRAEGVPQELVDRANEKMAAVNAAWNAIKRQRQMA